MIIHTQPRNCFTTMNKWNGFYSINLFHLRNITFHYVTELFLACVKSFRSKINRLSEVKSSEWNVKRFKIVKYQPNLQCHLIRTCIHEYWNKILFYHSDKGFFVLYILMRYKIYILFIVLFNIKHRISRNTARKISYLFCLRFP